METQTQCSSWEQLEETFEQPHPTAREEDITVNSQPKMREKQIPIMDEVMEELHQATQQYLSCSDPVEAEARRQRVMQSDANGDMEETAAAIIAGAVRRCELSSLLRASDSNPNTPPPRPSYSHHEPQILESHVLFSPRMREEENMGLDSRYSDVDFTPRRGTDGPTKLKSIIISPSNEEEEEAPLMIQESQEARKEEETLSEFQNKVATKKTKKGDPHATVLIYLGEQAQKGENNLKFNTHLEEEEEPTWVTRRGDRRLQRLQRTMQEPLRGQRTH